MKTLLSFCLEKQRAVLFIFLFILVGGGISYLSIAKEATPNITIPYAVIDVVHAGISTEDSETLLLKPLEENIQNIPGLKEIWSTAFEGGAKVILEFRAGSNLDKALQDTQTNVDKAKSKFPAETKDPTVEEINLSLFPVLLVKLSGNVSGRALYKIAEDLKTTLKTRVPSILDVEIVGKEEEVVEVLLEPKKVENYGLLTGDVLSLFERNNALVSSGSLTMGPGNFAVKLSGMYKTLPELLKAPLLNEADFSVTVGDVSDIRRTFKEPSSYARDKGLPTVALEISKRTGQNIIETIENIKHVVATEQKSWPSTVQVSYASDNSTHIREMLHDLRNEITSALILVMIVILASLGLRSSILVGVAVPGSFLMGILTLNLMGYTLNTVVLFSLILSIGMLVDGAIVVVEHANRKLSEGYSSLAAYKEGSERMAWPVISSTITIIVAFLPLLFWPGIVGQFMKYLPITLIATLTASILMALVFVPSLGISFGHKKITIPLRDQKESLILEKGSSYDLKELSGVSGIYVRFLDLCLRVPLKPLLVASGIFLLVIFCYGKFGKGVVFFPDVEPDNAVVIVHGRGNLSIYEKDRLLKLVEEKILSVDGLASIYTRVGEQASSLPEDTIGSLNLEFSHWKERPKASLILKEIQNRTKDIPGIIVETRKEQKGPSQGKPIVLEISSKQGDDLLPVLRDVRNIFEQTVGLINIEDDRPLPGVEWELSVNRPEALKYGADIKTIGKAIQLLTQGLKIGSYRPKDAQDEIDITLRFPSKDRTLERLKNLHLTTSQGQVALSNFVTATPKPRVNMIHRVGLKRTYKLQADVLPGVLADKKVQELKEKVKSYPLKGGIEINFKGEDKDQQETLSFLLKAFGVTVFLIALILVIQFNSFFSMFLVLSSIGFSTLGVFVGLMVTAQPFGIVMGGIGIIALSGIIVSNNIIFIDTFDHLKAKLKKNYTLSEIHEVILRTGAQRLRPVILTKLTIVLGLLPIMFQINIDYLGRVIQIGAPSSQWWTLLATTIVFGVLFASPLTLILTPSLLMLREKLSKKV